MRIAAITRFKHGAMLEALRAVGWSQGRLAKEMGTTPATIGDYINLKRKPKEDMLNRIQLAFGQAGHFVDVTAWFPEKFKGFKERLEVVEVREIDHLQLEDSKDERAIYLEDGLDKLTDREQRVLAYRGDGLTLGQVAIKLNPKHPLGAETIRQIEFRAMRRLRHHVESAIIQDESSIGVDADVSAAKSMQGRTAYEEFMDGEKDTFTKALARGDRHNPALMHSYGDRLKR